MAEITKLGLIKREPGTPVEAVVKAARQLLKEAKEGKVRGVCIITAVEEDGKMGTASDWQTPGDDLVYFALRTGLSTTLVRIAMKSIDPGGDADPGPELTEEDE